MYPTQLARSTFDSTGQSLGRSLTSLWLTSTHGGDLGSGTSGDSASTRVSFGPVGGSATVVAEAGSVSMNVTASQQQSSGQVSKFDSFDLRIN